WVGENIALGFLISIAALGKDAVFLFHRQASRTAALVVGFEIGHNIVQLDAALFVGIEHNRLHQYRLIRIAHIHLPNHIHKHILTVGVIDKRPAVLFGIFLQGFFLEIFEGAVFAHGDDQIWHQLALADIAFDSLRLDIYTAYKLHL